MNELERAATALRDRPSSPPAPLESIERRAGVLRRRRHLLEGGAIALVLLLLGTGALALSAARTDDKDQGVFVGEGPSGPAAPSVATYRLASPVDDATAEALQQTIESRFFYFGAADAQVRVDGTVVSVTTTRSMDRIDQLVMLPGGLDVWPVIGEVAVTPTSCDPPGPDGTVVIRPAMADPSRCVRVTAEHRQIVAGFAAGAGYELDPDGSYRVDVSLGPIATQALIDALGPPAGSDGSASRIVVVTADTGFFLAEVTIDLTTPSVVLKIRNFPNADEAARWAAILSHPLPEGASFES